MAVAPIRPASTVVLLRPTPHRFEVFLVRRHDNIAFMGGASVFPGGRVEDADRLDAAGELCDGLDEAVTRTTGMPQREAVGHYVAAIRELFEETGVLLARRGGRLITFDNEHEAAAFRDYRKALASGAISLREIADREHLRMAVDELALFAHWVTPDIEIKRFDTRFFAATVPPRQEPVHDDYETTQSAWLDPVEALERCRRDEIDLPPPTWTTLRMLARYSSVAEVMRWARQTPIVRVQPGFIKRDDVTMLTLPGDPLHPAIEGFEIATETRFLLDNGRWRATLIQG
jgi:8-oxo-dGTP pyrophosphatase MutT (NUDIX family)